LIEQDHRNIKSRTNAMLGFRQFSNAAITIAGIELMHRIRKGQFASPDCISKRLLRLMSESQSSRLDKVSY
jgi:transposase-like protein